MFRYVNSVAVRAGVLLLLWFVVFAPVLPSLWDDWVGHSDNSHGLLVPLIAGYFAWQKRKELVNIALSPSPWGAWLLIGSLVIYVVAFVGDVAFISRVMMISSLIGLLLFNFGWEFVRVMLFPLLFLFFMIPVPVSLIEKVSIPLQLFASTASAHLIALLSIPVYQEGNILYFAQTQLEVAQACSGLRSIMALTMLSVIFVHLSRSGMTGKIVLLLSAIPIALLANILRVTATGVLAHFYGSMVAKGFLHEFSGIVVFAVGFLVLSLEYSLLNKITAN